MAWFSARRARLLCLGHPMGSYTARLLKRVRDVNHAEVQEQKRKQRYKEKEGQPQQNPGHGFHAVNTQNIQEPRANHERKDILEKRGSVSPIQIKQEKRRHSDRIDLSRKAQRSPGAVHSILALLFHFERSLHTLQPLHHR